MTATGYTVTVEMDLPEWWFSAEQQATDPLDTVMAFLDDYSPSAYSCIGDSQAGCDVYIHAENEYKARDIAAQLVGAAFGVGRVAWTEAEADAQPPDASETALAADLSHFQASGDRPDGTDSAESPQEPNE